MIINDNPILETPAPLPIGGTLMAAIRMVKNEWREMFRMLALPCLLLAVMGVLFAQKTQLPDGKEMDISAPYFITSLLLTPWLAVSLLRYLVLGEKEGKFWPLYEPNMWRYLWRQIVLGLILVLPALVISIAIVAPIMSQGSEADGLSPWALLIGLILILVWMFIAANRFCIAAPAAAIGTDSRFKTSWQRTRGQMMRIALVKFLGTLMMMMPLLLVGAITWLVGQVSVLAASMISVFFSCMVQIAGLQVIDALLYSHFTRIEVNHE